jgi:hypothetical protein
VPQDFSLRQRQLSAQSQPAIEIPAQAQKPAEVPVSSESSSSPNASKSFGVVMPTPNRGLVYSISIIPLLAIVGLVAAVPWYRRRRLKAERIANEMNDFAARFTEAFRAKLAPPLKIRSSAQIFPTQGRLLIRLAPVGALGSRGYPNLTDQEDNVRHDVHDLMTRLFPDEPFVQYGELTIDPDKTNEGDWVVIPFSYDPRVGGVA